MKIDFEQMIKIFKKNSWEYYKPCELAELYVKDPNNNALIRDFCNCLARLTTTCGGVYNIPNMPYAIHRIEKTYNDYVYKATLIDGGNLIGLNSIKNYLKEHSDTNVTIVKTCKINKPKVYYKITKRKIKE